VGEANTDVAVYGKVNPYIVGYGDVVEVIVNNLERGVHPFHLHGYNFQVLARPPSGSGWFPGDGAVQYAENPVLRDTVSVMSESYLVIRFRANNPGVYLFHCHVEWHVEMGLTATFIVGPDILRNMTIPDSHKEACSRLNIPTEGNAGGNTVDYLDESNYNTAPPEAYQGYVAPVAFVVFVCSQRGVIMSLILSEVPCTLTVRTFRFEVGCWTCCGVKLLGALDVPREEMTGSSNSSIVIIALIDTTLNTCVTVAKE